ncbi:MAG: hypothetical protein ACRD0P_07640 [Stackebrandtia sp.]
MTTSTNSLASSIDRIQALIDRGATEGERDAARRAMERIVAKREKDTDSEYTGYYTGQRAYGSKYQSSYVPLKDIAAMMRADIKLAIKLAHAEAKTGEVAVASPFAAIPREVKITVRTSHFSGGGAIDITVRNIPEEWGWTVTTDHPDYWPGFAVYETTPELEALGDALKGIHWAYNYDGSDIQTDYFDVNFYGGVEAMHPNGYGRRIA